MLARSPHQRTFRRISCLFLIIVESCARYLTSKRAKNVRETSLDVHKFFFSNFSVQEGCFYIVLMYVLLFGSGNGYNNSNADHLMIGTKVP
jgi:hypothetical protein